MQLVGNEFTYISALAGSDISTFPDYPAEIRAPAGSLAGVSGFQLHFGNEEIETPGDQYDVLVAMNAAAFKNNFQFLKKGGILITNTSGFQSKHLRLAGFNQNPLLDIDPDSLKLIDIDISKFTKDSLSNSELEEKYKDRCKNMFVLGYLCWMFNRGIDHSISFIENKFKNQVLKDANLKVLKTGYNFGNTSEVSASKIIVDKAKLAKGTYRSIMGNKATAIGLVTASKKSNIELFYASYPITPASDLLHELSRLKNYGVKTFQAEDEIAAVCSAIGASFAGKLGICGSSGPGVALKAEALGLAIMLELPLVLIDVQRAGPSTGQVWLPWSR